MNGFADNDDCGDDHEGGAMVLRIVVDDSEGKIIWMDRLFAIEDSSATYFFSLAFCYKSGTTFFFWQKLLIIQMDH